MCQQNVAKHIPTYIHGTYNENDTNSGNAMVSTIVQKPKIIPSFRKYQRLYDRVHSLPRREGYLNSSSSQRILDLPDTNAHWILWENLKEKNIN